MENYHLGIQYPSILKDEEAASLMDGIEETGVNVDVYRVEPQAYAMLEWALPAAIAIHILKPYFESFLQEAGKDHYGILKKWIKNAAQKSRVMFITQTVDEAVTKPSFKTQSKVFSLHIGKVGLISINARFDEALSLEDWLIAIDDILDIMHQYSNGDISNPLSQYVIKWEITHGTLYAIIDRDVKQWRFLCNAELYQLQKNPS